MKHLIPILLIASAAGACSTHTAPSGSYSSASASVAAPVSTSNMETSILANVNAHRRSMGLGALQTNAAATQQAYEHSRNMATGRTAFGHDGFQKRIDNIRKTEGFISASAENVAYGNLTAREVVDEWLQSSGHRKNIEGNYALTGIGIYRDKQGAVYFTQIFFRK